jgi:hypothetical protein
MHVLIQHDHGKNGQADGSMGKMKDKQVDEPMAASVVTPVPRHL